MTLAPMRFKPHDEVTHLVGNKSSRNGSKIKLIVVHDTEGGNLAGIKDLTGLGEWFNTPASDCSAHVATDAEGNSARYVRDEDKAWHVAYYNSVSLGIEQVGFATEKVWPEAQLRETARWLAYWSHLHDVPLRKGRVLSNGTVVTTGVVRHSDLGVLGGGHHDPGSNYPLHDVLDLARAYVKHY